MKPKIPKGWHKLRKGTVTRIYETAGAFRGVGSNLVPGHGSGIACTWTANPTFVATRKRKEPSEQRKSIHRHRIPRPREDTVSKSLAKPPAGTWLNQRSGYLHIAEWLSACWPALSVVTSEELLRGCRRRRFGRSSSGSAIFSQRKPEFLVRRLYESGCRIIDGVRRREQELPACASIFRCSESFASDLGAALPEPVRFLTTRQSPGRTLTGDCKLRRRLR